MSLLVCPSCSDLCSPAEDYCPACESPLLPGLPRNRRRMPQPIRIHGLRCLWCGRRDCKEHDDLDALLDDARERVDLADVAPPDHDFAAITVIAHSGVALDAPEVAAT